MILALHRPYRCKSCLFRFFLLRVDLLRNVASGVGYFDSQIETLLAGKTWGELLARLKRVPLIGWR